MKTASPFFCKSMSALIALVLVSGMVGGILERRAEKAAEIRVQLIDVQFPEAAVE